MPTYEYQCTDCGNEWEAFQSMKEDALKDCPKCQKATAKRLISRGAGFILKDASTPTEIRSETPASQMSESEVGFRKRFEEVSGIKTVED